MCETIGAYGWYAGLRLFTWLTNHLLVRGVTHIVPHAFSPAPFPDLDCPPHFYARGENPQYRHQHLLSAYTNRLSHLLQGGRHVAPFAVLYHADAEWLGDAMPAERPLRLLAEAQLDADIVPADALPAASVSDSALVVGDEPYDALVVPGSPFLPEHVAAQLLRLDDAGVPVVFVDDVPKSSAPTPVRCARGSVPFRSASSSTSVSVMTDRAVRVSSAAPGPAGAADRSGRRGCRDARERVGARPRAHGHHRAAGGGRRRVRRVRGRAAAVPSRSDPRVGPRRHRPRARRGARAVRGRRGGVARTSPSHRPCLARRRHGRRAGAWSVSTATATEYPGFTPWATLDELVPLDRPDLLPRFSGTARYTASFTARVTDAARLDLGEAFEIATCGVNGVDLGTRIAPPYPFDVPAGVLAADNASRSRSRTPS